MMFLRPTRNPLAAQDKVGDSKFPFYIYLSD